MAASTDRYGLEAKKKLFALLLSWFVAFACQLD